MIAMTPADLIAQWLIASALCWVAMNPRKVARFLDELSNGNVERLERQDEARWWLSQMNERRVG